MADDTELFEIQVTDTGTQQVIANLERLGLTGEQAAARVASGYTRINTSTTGATSNLVLLSRAAKDGDVNMAALAEALDLCSNAELRAAERAGVFAEGQNRANRSAAEGRAALAAQRAEVAALEGSYGKLGGVLVGIAGYLGLHEFIEASDAATGLKNRIQSITEAGDEGFTTFQKLGTQIISFSRAAGVAEESGKNLNASLKLPDAESNLRTARAALDAFTTGVTSSGDAAARANAGTQELTSKLRDVGGVYSDAAVSATNYWHAVDVGTEIVGGNQTAEQRRLALINNVRTAMVELTKEQDRAKESTRSLSSASEETREIYDTLRDAAIRNGTSFEASTELFQRLAAGGKEVGLSFEDTARVTNLVGAQLRTFGVGARQARASMNELAEGFAEGEIKGKQLQAIIREFPQLLQPVANRLAGGSLEKLAAQFKATGIPIKAFADSYLAESEQIDRASGRVTLTISGALTSLRTAFDDYIGRSQTASVASDIIVGGLQRLAGALPTLIPLVAGLAATFALVKFAEYAAGFALVLSSLSPLTIVLATVAGIIAVVSNAFLDYQVQSGNAKDKTDAFYQALAPFKPVLSEIGGILTGLGAQFTAFISSFGTGATDAERFRSGLQSIADTVKLVIAAMGALASTVATVFGNMIKIAYNAGVVIGNVVNRIRGIGFDSDGIGESLDTGTVSLDSFGGPNAPKRDGGVIYARSGVNVGTQFRVPGVDSPDTVPLAMRVSRGERVIVQTEDQQAKHDAIMRAVKLGNITVPHFAVGGYIKASSQSTVGYSAGDTDKSSYKAPDVSSTGLTPAASIDTNASRTATQQQASNSQNNAWAFVNEYGSDGYAQDQQALAAGLFPYPGYPHQPGGDPNNYYTDGRSPEVHLFDGSKPTQQFAYAGASGSNIGFLIYQGIPQTGMPPEAAAYFQKMNYGKPPFNYAATNRALNHYNFRDGGEFEVPGAGPVDSRSINLAVSPGEKVRVQTADEVAREGKGSGTVRNTPPVNITIMANDPGAFGRSKRQVSDAVAKGLRRSPNN